MTQAPIPVVKPEDLKVTMVTGGFPIQNFANGDWKLTPTALKRLMGVNLVGARVTISSQGRGSHYRIYILEAARPVGTGAAAMIYTAISINKAMNVAIAVVRHIAMQPGQDDATLAWCGACALNGRLMKPDLKTPKIDW